MKNTSKVFKFCTFSAYYGGGLLLDKRRNHFLHHLFRLTSNSIDASGCFLVDKTARV